MEHLPGVCHTSLAEQSRCHSGAVVTAMLHPLGFRVAVVPGQGHGARQIKERL